MKDDDLIASLVNDRKPIAKMPGTGRALGMFLLGSGLAALAFTRGATALSESPDLVRVSLLGALVPTAAAGAIVSAVPGRASWRIAGMVTAAVLLSWLGAEAMRTASAWQRALDPWGAVAWTKCFVFTLAFGAIPAVLLARIVRGGWVVQPRATAALTFAAGASAGALTVALECPSSAPLHLLLGHALPIAGAAAAGAALAMRIFFQPIRPRRARGL